MQLQFKKLKIPQIQAQNFLMTPAELKDYIDFDVKRVYFISKPKGPTGQHCHLNEKEFFITLTGSCTAIINQGNGKEEIRLDAADAIYVGNYVWHGFKDFSNDAILLALSSTNYNPSRSDYIENYAEYQAKIEQMKMA